MSYIKVLINGKEYGLKFNQGALIKTNELTDKGNIAGTTLFAVVYAGLLMNAYVKKEEFTETFETVCDWVEELSPEVGVEIMKTFQQITIFQKALKEVEESKKKLTPENTDNSVTESPDV
jgi:hypothetical protein